MIKSPGTERVLWEGWEGVCIGKALTRIFFLGDVAFWVLSPTANTEIFDCAVHGHMLLCIESQAILMFQKREPQGKVCTIFCACYKRCHWKEFMFCHFTFTLQFLSYEWVIRLWMPHIFCKLQSRNIRHYYFDLFSILWFAGHAIPHLLFTASLKCRDGAEWANSPNIPGCERSGSCITVLLFSGQWRLKSRLTVLMIFPSSLKNNRELYFVICSKGNSVENEEWWYNFCFLKFQ